MKRQNKLSPAFVFSYNCQSNFDARFQNILPRLKIASRCSFDDKFLIVEGDIRTYKIHLGSGNISMKPNDQYLCIVANQAAADSNKVFLPFEGDQRLAVILSKAVFGHAETFSLLSVIKISKKFMFNP